MPELTAAFQAIAIRRMLQTQGSVHARRFCPFIQAQQSAMGLLTPRPYLIEVRGLRNIRPNKHH